MSDQYNLYLKQHIGGVKRGYTWLKENELIGKIRDILPKLGSESDFLNQIGRHDASKFDWDEEYYAYDEYFYGPNGINSASGEASDDCKEGFNYAWLHHIHNNPHHWQYWVLVNDDKENGTRVLEMPDRYILEMILDWWTFSWKNGDLYEIFNWWNEHSDYILLGEETRDKIVKIFRLILDKINEIGGEIEVE